MNINEIINKISNLPFNNSKKNNRNKNIPVTLTINDLIMLASSVNSVLINPNNSNILRDLSSPKSFVYNLISKTAVSFSSYLNDSLDISLITDSLINLLISKIISHFSLMR